MMGHWFPERTLMFPGAWWGAGGYQGPTDSKNFWEGGREGRLA